MLLGSLIEIRPVQANTEINLIYSIDDFRKIGDNLNGHYQLMKDLDFNGMKQYPIGSKDYPFKGIFDGNGFSISNYQIDHIEENAYTGLFGHAKNATFRNLYIKDTTLEIGKDLNVELFGGALLGKGESVKLENIHIDSSVSVTINPLFKSTVGGLVGELKGTDSKPSSVTNVSNAGKVVGKNEVGGIAGSAHYTEFKLVKNKGTIDSNHSAGGIVGYLYRGKLNQAENSDEVQSTSRGGGIIGYASYTVVENVLNRGLIQSNGSWGNFGGVVGYMVKTTLSDAKNEGGFELKGNLTDVGGLVGEATQESIIRRGINHSTIETDGTIGGIVASASQALIEQTYNEGNLSGSASAGIGASISNVVIRDSFNWGNVQGHTTAGGIVGYEYQNSKIETSYNSGYVKAYTRGALAGYFNGTMFGVYGITHSTLIGKGDEQGVKISPFASITIDKMPELSSSIWEFTSTGYPVLKQLERPKGNQQHPIAIKHIDLKKTEYRQYETVDIKNGQAVLNTNIGTTISTPLTENMIQYNRTLERSGEQSISFLISGLSESVRVNVTPRYRAIFLNHENSRAEVQYIEPGQKASSIILPTREGYTLEGWTPEFVPLSRDQFYKPIYVKNDYWIRVMDGENQLEAFLLSHGERLSQVMTTPVKANHFFVGLFEDKAFTKQLEINQVATKSIDLFAKFVPAPTLSDTKVTSKGGHVTVTWKGTNNPSHYNVDVSSSPDFVSYTRYTTKQQQYQLTLGPKNEHYIRVTPVQIMNDQEWEGTSETVVQPILMKPLNSIAVSSITSTSVQLKWNQQSYSQFYIYRSEDYEPFRQVATVKSSIWTDKNLNHRKNYRYNIVGYLATDENSGYLSDPSQIVSVRLKTPFTGSWKIDSVGEGKKIITGSTSTKSGYIEVFKGSKKIAKKTAVYNGLYRVTIPKQVAGTKLTIKFSAGTNYDLSTKQVIVKKVFSTLKVNAPAATDRVLTGKGKPGAIVRAYVGEKPISKTIKIGKSGSYRIAIPLQRGGREIRVKMSRSGYIDRTVKTKVLYIFKVFKVNSVRSSQNYVKGKGEPGAKIQAFVGSKSISKPITVGKKGDYRIAIKKQKKGKIIKVKMTKPGYKVQEKSVKVSR